VACSIQNPYTTILNYFDNRSTKALAESFNRATNRTKIKGWIIHSQLYEIHDVLVMYFINRQEGPATIGVDGDLLAGH